MNTSREQQLAIAREKCRLSHTVRALRGANRGQGPALPQQRSRSALRPQTADASGSHARRPQTPLLILRQLGRAREGGKPEREWSHGDGVAGRAPLGGRDWPSNLGRTPSRSSASAAAATLSTRHERNQSEALAAEAAYWNAVNRDRAVEASRVSRSLTQSDAHRAATVGVAASEPASHDARTPPVSVELRRMRERWGASSSSDDEGGRAEAEPPGVRAARRVAAALAGLPTPHEAMLLEILGTDMRSVFLHWSPERRGGGCAGPEKPRELINPTDDPFEAVLRDGLAALRAPPPFAEEAQELGVDDQRCPELGNARVSPRSTSPSSGAHVSDMGDGRDDVKVQKGGPACTGHASALRRRIRSAAAEAAISGGESVPPPHEAGEEFSSGDSDGCVLLTPLVMEHDSRNGAAHPLLLRDVLLEELLKRRGTAVERPVAARATSPPCVSGGFAAASINMSGVAVDAVRRGSPVHRSGPASFYDDVQLRAAASRCLRRARREWASKREMAKAAADQERLRAKRERREHRAVTRAYEAAMLKGEGTPLGKLLARVRDLDARNRALFVEQLRGAADGTLLTPFNHDSHMRHMCAGSAAAATVLRAVRGRPLATPAAPRDTRARDTARRSHQDPMYAKIVSLEHIVEAPAPTAAARRGSVIGPASPTMRRCSGGAAGTPPFSRSGGGGGGGGGNAGSVSSLRDCGAQDERPVSTWQEVLQVMNACPTIAPSDIQAADAAFCSAISAAHIPKIPVAAPIRLEDAAVEEADEFLDFLDRIAIDANAAASAGTPSAVEEGAARSTDGADANGAARAAADDGPASCSTNVALLTTGAQPGRPAITAAAADPSCRNDGATENADPPPRVPFEADPAPPGPTWRAALGASKRLRSADRRGGAAQPPVVRDADDAGHLRRSVDPRLRLAVLIGVGRYADPRIPDDEQCIIDVMELQQILAGIGFDVAVMHHRAADPTLVPTRNNILATVARTATKAQGRKDSIVLVFFSGAGLYVAASSDSSPGISPGSPVSGSPGSPTTGKRRGSRARAATLTATKAGTRPDASTAPMSLMCPCDVHLSAIDSTSTLTPSQLSKLGVPGGDGGGGEGRGAPPNIVVCDTYSIHGLQQGSPQIGGFGVVGGRSSIGGELLVEYASRHRLMLSFYFKRALTGWATRDSRITTNSVNTYMKAKMEQWGARVVSSCSSFMIGDLDLANVRELAFSRHDIHTIKELTHQKHAKFSLTLIPQRNQDPATHEFVREVRQKFMASLAKEVARPLLVCYSRCYHSRLHFFMRSTKAERLLLHDGQYWPHRQRALAEFVIELGDSALTYDLCIRDRVTPCGVLHVPSRLSRERLMYRFTRAKPQKQAQSVAAALLSPPAGSLNGSIALRRFADYEGFAALDAEDEDAAVADDDMAGSDRPVTSPTRRSDSEDGAMSCSFASPLTNASITSRNWHLVGGGGGNSASNSIKTPAAKPGAEGDHRQTLPPRRPGYLRDLFHSAGFSIDGLPVHEIGIETTLSFLTTEYLARKMDRALRIGTMHKDFCVVGMQVTVLDEEGLRRERAAARVQARYRAAVTRRDIGPLLRLMLCEARERRDAEAASTALLRDMQGAMFAAHRELFGAFQAECWQGLREWEGDERRSVLRKGLQSLQRAETAQRLRLVQHMLQPAEGLCRNELLQRCRLQASCRAWGVLIRGAMKVFLGQERGRAVVATEWLQQYLQLRAKETTARKNVAFQM